MPSCFSFSASARTALGPCSFDCEVLPDPAQKLFHSKYLPQLATECCSFHQFSPLSCLHWLFALLNSPLVAAMLAQIDCVNFTTVLRHNGSELEVLEALFTASMVAQVQGPHSFTYRTWHKAALLNLFLAKISMPSPLQGVILRFFRFSTYHPPFFSEAAFRRERVAALQLHTL